MGRKDVAAVRLSMPLATRVCSDDATQLFRSTEYFRKYKYRSPNKLHSYIAAARELLVDVLYERKRRKVAAVNANKVG